MAWGWPCSYYWAFWWASASCRLAVQFQRWMQSRFHSISQRLLQRFFFFFARVVALGLAELGGVEMSAAADRTPLATYLLGVAAGVIGSMTALRRKSRSQPESRES